MSTPFCAGHWRPSFRSPRHIRSCRRRPTSCFKGWESILNSNPSSPPSPTDTHATTATAVATSILKKRGVGAWYTETVGQNLADLGVGWYYTWRPSTADAGFSAPAGIEHVPMIWGLKEATPETINAAQAEPSPYLLGFNEPDNAEQSNMSVDKAISL